MSTISCARPNLDSSVIFINCTNNRPIVASAIAPNHSFTNDSIADSSSLTPKINPQIYLDFSAVRLQIHTRICIETCQVIQFVNSSENISINRFFNRNN